MVIHHIIPSEDITIYLLELPHLSSVDSISLTKEEKQKLNSLKSPSRKREYLAVRSLLHHTGLKGKLIYKNKRPKLKDSPYKISLSHCKTHAALALSQQEVGVDVETPGNRIRKTVGKFLGKDETQMAGNDIHKLTLFWSAKESIYKINNRLNNFKRDMRITALDMDKQYIGVECKDKHRSCFFKDMSDVIVTWCVD
ncbi:MAG: 4'-phosphopantetheinyl transferase family protein [Bacteroidota bacterium]